MSTLAVVEEILKTSGAPISVREIVERAGARLPSKSKTPDTVVARDLAMDIKRQGDASRFVRTAPGRYTLRALVAAPGAEPTPIAATALKQERAAALPAKRDVTRHEVQDGFSQAPPPAFARNVRTVTSGR